MYFSIALLISMLFLRYKHKFPNEGFNSIAYDLFPAVIFFIVVIVTLPNWIFHNIYYKKYSEQAFYSEKGSVKDIKSLNGERMLFSINEKEIIVFGNQEYCFPGDNIDLIFEIIHYHEVELDLVSFDKPNYDSAISACIVRVKIIN